MRIAIDAHAVGAKLGGNESYAINLIEALAQIDSVNQYTIYITTDEARECFQGRWPNFKVRATLPHTPLIRIPLTLSAEKSELQRVRHTYGIDGDYILSVGSIQPRKKLARLVRAYASLRGNNSASKLPKLVLVGKDTFHKRICPRFIRGNF